MGIVTITYPNRIILEAVLLSHDDNEIRAIAAGADEVLTLLRIHGVWVSEDLEPVAIRFEWERRREIRVYSEGDYVCSNELAAHLIQMLSNDSQEVANLDYGRQKETCLSASLPELRAN